MKCPEMAIQMGPVLGVKKRYFWTLNWNFQGFPDLGLCKGRADSQHYRFLSQRSCRLSQDRPTKFVNFEIEVLVENECFDQEWPRQTKPKKGQFMNFLQGHSGTKVQCELCLFS